jgi:formylglycine-generating enzyme required for sulfatase activity
MKQRLRRPGSALLGLVLMALVAAGCGSAATTAARGTPTVTPTQLTLTVLHVTVTRSGGSGPPADLRSDDSVTLQVQDRVAVGDKGRALIKFADQLAVELMSGTQVEVRDVRQDSGNTLVELKQASGHSHIQMEKDPKAQVAVVTDYARLTPGGENPQLLVCHVPGVLTCVVAVNGEAQVQAQNQTVTVHSGESTYVFPGQAPRVPICANMSDVRLWLQKARSSGDAGNLGSLVVDWPQQPCAGTARAVAETDTPPASAAAPPAPAVPAASPTAAPTGTATPASTSTLEPTTAPTGTATPAATPKLEPSAPPANTATPAPSSTPGPYGPSAEALPPGKDMVHIPAGQYVVGSPDIDENHIATRQAALSEFWIDQYEATNAQYKSFLKQTGRPAPPGWTDGDFASGHEAHPAAGLNWDDAVAYCAWADKRLPTEAEWEVAGRGPGAAPALYPWGPDPTASGKADELPKRDTYPVGTIAFNKSPFGAYDMTGSVWQWVGEPYAPVPDGERVLRGGRHGLLQDMAYRQPAKPDDERFTRVAGVRCATDRVTGE